MKRWSSRKLSGNSSNPPRFEPVDTEVLSHLGSEWRVDAPSAHRHDRLDIITHQPSLPLGAGAVGSEAGLLALSLWASTLLPFLLHAGSIWEERAREAGWEVERGGQEEGRCDGTPPLGPDPTGLHPHAKACVEQRQFWGVETVLKLYSLDFFCAF